MLFKKGDQIASYTVVFPHKQGAYAETYRVKDTSGKICFLKIINLSKLGRNQIDDNGSVTEVEIVKQLRHHNLPLYIDSGNLLIRGAQFVWFSTEFISGETLFGRVTRNSDISIYEIKTIATSVLSALSSLHSLPTPVIHNEVTIQNVLLNLTSGLDDLKLIDFGHARYLSQPPIKPDISEINPFYLARERFSGVCCVQSDLYSVGVIMYQLLYGKLPWFVDVSRISNNDLVDAILTERDNELDLPQVSKFEMDPQLTNCIAKALCSDVEDRFQTTEEFIKAINGEIVIDRPLSKVKALSSNSESNKNHRRNTSRKEGRGFAAIAGMNELKEQLRNEVIEPLHNPEEYERYGVTIPNGMLLYGPPGCGKTFFAKHFAEEVGFNFMCMTPASLKSRYVNATQENIAQMFAAAEEKSPTIIFIDEINELVPNREGDVHEMSRSAVNEMLAQMDRTGERRIFVIGATNYPHMIDPAILRAGRIDKKYYIGVPDKDARTALFKLYLSKRPVDFGIDYKRLSDLTENYVSADIQLIINDAARNALKQRSKITMELLTKSILDTRPSLNNDELKRYEDIRANMTGEAKKTEKKDRPRIGFK